MERAKACERCGKSFILPEHGYGRSKYCLECKVSVMREASRKYHKDLRRRRRQCQSQL